MKHVAAVRKRLGTPTIFNILGPLVNPASAPFQLLGVGRAELQPLLAEALLLLGARRALVVHGSDGLDEVTLGGTTDVIELAGGQLRRFQWQPADFGLEPAGRETMLVSGPEESAAMIREILAGRQGSAARHRGGQRGRRTVDGRAVGPRCRNASGGRRKRSTLEPPETC